MTGRPSIYSDELVKTICTRLAMGESLKAICADDGMPCQATVYNWLQDNSSFLEKYTQARAWQAEAAVDEMHEIADDATNDWMERLDEDGKPVGWMLNGEHVQRSRLRIETRKWTASKLAPKKYGDKIHHATDPNDPMKMVHEVVLKGVRADVGAG